MKKKTQKSELIEATAKDNVEAVVIPTWEYKQRYFGAHDMPGYAIADYLNEEGKEGWELIQIIDRYMINEPSVSANYTFFFKRIKTG